MSRVSAGDTMIVKPTSNIYTVLAFVATVAVGLAVFVVYFRSQTLFKEGSVRLLTDGWRLNTNFNARRHVSPGVSF